MVKIMRNFKSFQFSTWSIVLWVVGTVVGALTFYFLTEEYLGFWIEGGIVHAVVGILKMLGAPINVELSESSAWRFTGFRYSATMAYGCTGFEIVAVCFAFLLFHPHPQNAVDSKGIWQRKAKAILISVGIMQGVNTLRLIIEMSQLYNWTQYHTFVGIAEAFITLPVLMHTRRWLPELMLPTFFNHKLDDVEVFQNLGINTIEQLLREDPYELAIILGVSAGIVKKWMRRARSALESPENSDVYVDLFDICLWYSRAKSRGAKDFEFRQSQDSNDLIKKDHGPINKISKGGAVWYKELSVPK